MALITLPYSNEAQLRAAWASIPADVIASGNTYVLEQAAARVNLDQWFIINNKNTGPANKIVMQAAPGASYSDNPAVSTNAFPGDFNDGRAAITMTAEASRKFMILVEIPYFEIRGLDIRQLGTTNENALKFSDVAHSGWVDRCIIDSAGSGNYRSPLMVDGQNVRVTSTLVVHRSNVWYAVNLGTKTSKLENVQVVRPSNFTKGNFAINVASDGNEFINCSFFGFDEFVNQPNAFPSVGSNNAGSGTINFGTNNLPNLNVADQLVNPLNDFRTKLGSVLIDAGTAPAAYNTSAPNGVRQQGYAADIGAWEQPSALVAPSATINNVVISGANNNNVVISGVTTGVPTEAIVSIFPANIEYNGAVGQGPVEATLTTNALSVAFQDLRVGAYGISVDVSNDAYSAAGVNAFGTFQIVGAGALTVVQEPMSGEVLTIHGTTFGNPTSGTFYLPPSDTPNGAVGQTAPLVLTPGAFTVSKAIPPGNYDEAILIFENAQGKSFPQPGTSPVSVIEISGNPQAPDPGGENPDEPDAPIALISTANRQFNISSAAAVTVSGAVGLTATIKLVARPGAAPLTTMTGLKWAWWDQATPNLFEAPRNQGVLGTIDPSVDLVLNIPNSALQSGGIGCVAITNDDGDAVGGHMAFFGSVRVN